MSDLIYKFFGEGKDLTALQMGDRAFVMFFVTLILLRIGGLRAFGQQSAFDNVIVIMLGAILSRAVVGASPFLPIVIAGFVLVFVHRILAVISMYNDFVSDLIKGKPTSLYKNGKLNEKNMRRCDITKGDLMEGLRHNANLESLEEAKEIFLERNGHISVVKK
jgi:uncharacterized membrane protein YcaP (DUF421 family)